MNFNEAFMISVLGVTFMICLTSVISKTINKGK